MSHSVKEVNYIASNTYSVLNTLTSGTRNIWIVFHGLGYLSRYFIKHFEPLPSGENYIIAPQAPSKYYQDNTYTYVGASWLTKENTIFEVQNVVNYLDAITAKEKVFSTAHQDKKFICLGFSQGVSVMLRWLARNKQPCDSVIIHSGGIPKELTPDDFSHLGNQAQVTLLYGNRDPYITEERNAYEKQRAEELFGSRLQVIEFEGTHKIHLPTIRKITGL